MKAFDRHVDATFFWTAHNEIEAKWDYVKAWDLGWIDKPLPEKLPKQADVKIESIKKSELRETIKSKILR